MPRTLTEQEFTAIRDKVLAALPAGLSEADFNRFAPQALDGAIGEAENLPKPLEGSALSRFLSNLGDMVNPVSIATGLVTAVRHPIDTLTHIGSDMADQGAQAVAAAKQGDLVPAAGHAAAAVVPIVGPAAAGAAEQMSQGDVAGGFGKVAGLILPVGAPTVVRGAAKAIQTLPEGAAAAAEASAASRVADVMAPKVGANKVRFGGMAEDVAPQVAKDLATEGAPWTRQGLQTLVGSKLADAEAALDAASDARLNARTLPTKPIIDALKAKRQALTAEAVDASAVPPRTTTRASVILDANGKPIPVTAATAKPVGADVVPGPNAARVAMIDHAIDELQRLGPVARYEPIRRIRQAYDGPAKAVYNPSVTQDFLTAQGGKLGAADVTGVLRDTLATWDPKTAEANAAYSLYRKASDVLDATAEVERTRPRVGRQIMSRLTLATAGGEAAGVKGAAVGYVLSPIVDAAASSGATTQLKTAALMQKLATAIRGGEVPTVDSTLRQLRRLTVTAGEGVGATSPTERQTPTTAPASP